MSMGNAAALHVPRQLIPITGDDTHRRSDARTLGTAERTKVEENAVEVKQGHRAGTGTVHGQSEAKMIDVKRPLNCCNSSTARRVSENTA